MRYSKQIKLKNFGHQSQEKLSNASVLVIGAGGLGCPVLTYLVMAGIGKIGIVDFDLVEESNLPRQPLYQTGDIGKLKVEVAANSLSKMNPDVSIEKFTRRLDASNAASIIEKFDFIADCSDNFTTRYLINDTCIALNKPWVFASIEEWQGQVSVFNSDGGPSYRDLYPQPPLPGESPDCNDLGIIGTIASITGSMQANEIIKCITGIGEVLSGRLWIADLLNNNFSEVGFEKIHGQDKSPVPRESLPDTEISLEEYLSNTDSYTLFDIRNEYDYDDTPSPGMNVSFDEIMENFEQLDETKKYLFLCYEGRKSLFLAKHLNEKHKLTNVFSLEGGLKKFKAGSLAK